MLKKRTRFVALLLALSIAAPSVVWADTGQEIDVSALRVSEAFAAKHPNGMFEVLSPYIMTGEGKEFDFYVLRRGGTEGAASVNIKAVEISAKYGEDFILQEKDALGFYHDLKKSTDNPTVLENQIEQNKDILFTTDRLASGAGIDVYAFDETASGAAVEVSDDTSGETEVLESTAPKSISVDEALKQEDAPVTAYSDDMGSYTSALHKMRDEATGVTTPTVSDSAAYSLDDVFEVKNKEEVQLANDAAEAFDGLAYTVDFKDGEAYKIIHVKITDDDVYEAQEAFSLSLYDPTNGAEIGEQNSSSVIIDDDEKVEKSNIGFASENYQVFSDADGVTVTLKREGNVNDYVNVYVSTLADSAKADEDYTPVMGDMMFLPGETEKKIYVPILKDNIAEKDLTESLYFDITAETEDNADITGKRTRVEILPYANTDNQALVNVMAHSGSDENGKVTAYSAEDAPVEVYADTGEYQTMVGRNWSRMTASATNFWGCSAWSYYNGNVDLVGIERIAFKWQNNGISASSYNSRQVSTVTFGGVTKSKYKTFDETTGEISASEMQSKNLRNDNTSYEFKAYCEVGNKMNLWVYDVFLYYTKFNFLTKAPDKLTYNVYNGTGAGNVVSSAQFTPGTTTVSASDFRKYNYIRAYANLNDEGRQYGCTAKDVTLTGNDKSITKSSGEYIYVDNGFIKDYIYNGNQAKSTLTAKANFTRTEKVNKIHIAKYENGIVKIGGTAYNDTDLTSNVWYKGDKLRLEIIPDQGYHIANITADGKTYKQGDDISLANNMTLKVEFARDDNSVSVLHGYVGTYNYEDLDANAKHGYVSTPNLINEKYVAPMTRTQYINSLSEEERNSVLLSAYQQYVQDNGMSDKFANEIPQFYLDLTGYKVSNKNLDYKAYLTVQDYKNLLVYFGIYKNDEEIDRLAKQGRDGFLKIIKNRLSSGKKKYASDLEIYFSYTSGGLLGNDTIYYNNQNISRYRYVDLIDDFVDAIGKDDFANLSQKQIDFLDGVADLKIVPTDKTQMAIYKLSTGGASFDGVDEAAALDSHIEQPYAEYIKKYNAEKAKTMGISNIENYAVNNLTTGDTVNLVAQLEDGYTCVWVYNDNAKNIKESDQALYTIHVGDSFSFEVQNKAATVKYYFVPINDRLPDTIVHGRIIRPTQTLRTKGSERVDINNSSTYQAVQGADITIGSIGANSSVVDGKTYYTTTQTDANGYFNVLVPHGMEGLLTNIIVANGEKTYVKHAVILDKSDSKDQTIVFALPYQNDEIWVRSFEFNCNESTKEGVYVEDKNITLTAALDVADGYNVSQVVLRSYNVKGDLVKSWQMDPQGGYVYKSTFNAKEYLKDGGRLTIEAYDGYGRGVGQVESGCIFTEPPQPTQVGMPAMDELGGASFDTVGSVTPELDSGDYVMTPTKMEYDESTGTMTTTEGNGEPFEIAVLSGTIIKNEIKAATEDGSSVFINGTAIDRVARLTAAIDPLSSNITISNPKATGQSGENTWKKPDGMGKVGAKGGKLSHSVGLDVGFYISLKKEHTDDGEVKYYYDQIYAIFGVNVNAQKDFQIFIGPVPCYITLKGGITVKGLLGMVPNPGVDKRLSMDGIKMDTDVLREGGMDVAGLIIIKPRLTLGAGVGVRGAFSVGVSGNMVMDIAYQPWSDGAGTVEFSLNVDIDIGFIPISFAIAKVKLGMFYTDNYHENSWLDFSNAANKLDFDNYVKTLSVDDETTISGSMGRVARGHGNTLETPIRTFAADESDSPITAYAENDVRETLKHPKPQLLHLSGKKQIMFYMGDDASRADYDCQAVYYVLYDGTKWGQPVKVDDDGTTDMDFNAVQAGDKVILVYSDLNKQFGNTLSDVPEYLNSSDMSVRVFDGNGNMGEEKQLTKEDNFSNSMPRIAYDEKTGRTLIAYLATDYNDSRADFGYSTMGELNSFLNNSYGTVCYKMYDGDFNEVGYSSNELTYLAYEEHYGEDSLDNQRFVPVAVDTLNVNEMTANAYMDKVYITYTVDTDGNSETSDDMELYASVIDINNNSSVGPIRLTTNDVQDSNPQTVEYDGKIFIYWNRNGNIVYADLDSTLGGDIVQTNNGYTAGDMFFNVVQEGSDAAQTFRISYEPNGILYLTWNQLDSNIEVVNDEEVSIAKRSIYMRTYDPHYKSESYTDEETGETNYIYTGMWGAATEFDVPDNNYEMFSEQTFTALDADNAVCAYRRFMWVDNGDGVKEAPNSDLVIASYHVVSTLDITDVYSDPQYPTIGDDAVLHVKVQNAGVLPSESVTFKAKMTDSEGNVTDLGEDTVYTHLATSSEVEGSFTYKVPENGDSYTFTITAWEENLTEDAAVYKKTFTKAPVIENIDPQLTRTNNAYENIKAAFVNKGNKATGEMTLKVSARNNGENAQLDELLNTTIGSLEPNETVSIDEEILIGESWGSGNMIRLYISLENADGELYSEIADIYLLSDEDLDVTDIVINDGNEETIEVNAGEWAAPHFEITPIGAMASNKLVYSISDSDIADIDPSNGRVYGKKEGTATITVSAVNSKYSLFVDEDNNTYDSEGNLILFDENGVVNEPALAEAGGSSAVLTKQVQVKVTGTLPETTTEITTEATTETTSEVTTKSSSSRSSGGGGGGSSSRIAAATTTTEETSETTTADVENNTEATTENTADDYTGFIDVKGLWCENIVNTLHDLGLVNGRTEDKFAPNDNLTRAELVQLLANLSGADLSVYANADAKFADVDTNAWYYAAVMWAADNNIVYGVGNDMFAPDTSITREDTAAIIYRYLGVDAAADSNNFTDTNEISAYASDAVNTLSAVGIINGYPDNTFRPKNTITRAEAASVLYGVNNRQYKNIGNTR